MNIHSYLRAIYVALKKQPKLLVSLLIFPYGIMGALMTTIYMLNWIQARYIAIHPDMSEAE